MKAAWTQLLQLLWMSLNRVLRLLACWASVTQSVLPSLQVDQPASVIQERLVGGVLADELLAEVLDPHDVAVVVVGLPGDHRVQGGDVVAVVVHRDAVEVVVEVRDGLVERVDPPLPLAVGHGALHLGGHQEPGVRVDRASGDRGRLDQLGVGRGVIVAVIAAGQVRLVPQFPRSRSPSPSGSGSGPRSCRWCRTGRSPRPRIGRTRPGWTGSSSSSAQPTTGCRTAPAGCAARAGRQAA